MKIGRDSSYLDKTFGIDKAIDMIADAGFDGIDYTDNNPESRSDNYKEMAKRIRDKAESRGISIYQTHAPTPLHLLSEGDMDYCKKWTIRSLEFSSLLGAEAAVVHPVQSPLHKLGDESVYEQNMDYFRHLIPYCEKFNIKIAIENMCKRDAKSGVVHDGVCSHPLEFAKFIDDLDSEYVTGCLDTGHCAITGREPYDLLRLMGGDRITCLHVHDNDYKSDMHCLPYTVSHDWDMFCKTLADIDYKGNFTLESCNFIPKFPLEFVPTALKFECDVAKFMVKTIEKHKAMK